MKFLLDEQRRFDDEHFNLLTWQIDDWRAQKTRHISLHISKAAQKLVNNEEWNYTGRDLVEEEVIPDLSIYRAQLLTTHDINLKSLALEGIDTRGMTDSVAAISLIRAQGELAHWLEPLEHGATLNDEDRYRYVSSAVEYVHNAVEGLAQQRGIDVLKVHRDRMETLLGAKAYILSQKNQ
jgi:hypothetical protein